MGRSAGYSVLVAVLALGLGTCGVGVSRHEVLRAASPGAAYDAVLIETNAGATTSFGYEVHVVKHGAAAEGPPAARLYGATRSDSAYGANLRWQGPHVLAVEYLTARSAEHVGHIQVDGERIEITLRDGVADPEAPPGGMHHNLAAHRR